MLKIEANKSHSVHLRMSAELYEWLSENAAILGVTIPDFLRMVLNTVKATSKAVDRETERLRSANANGENPAL